MTIFWIILIIVSFAIGFAIGARLIWKTADEALKTQDKQTIRANAYYNVLNQWLKDIHDGKFPEEWFVRNEYKTVAIYGFAELGMRFYEEMKSNTKVEVVYIIDRNSLNIASDLEIYSPDDILPEVDVIVVTPVHVFASIDKMLRKKVKCPVVSLEDVIYDL